MPATNASRSEFLAAREATGPAPISVLRLLRGYSVDPLVRWTEIREAHGDVARYRFGTFDTFFVTHPEGAKRVLQDNVANYSKQHPSYAMLRRVFGNGLLTSEGAHWLRQRRLAQPAFHRERLAAMGVRMTAAALETAARWERLAAAETPFSMLEELSRLTLRIVGEALFGAGLEAQTDRVAAAWNTLNGQLIERFSRRRLLPAILPTRYDRAFREARRTLFEVVAELVSVKRRALGEDLLSMLIAARDADTGEGMTDAQLRDEVVTLLLAGHETTAVALGWVWVLLDGHPEAATALRAELATVLGGRPPTVADVERLPFTRGVVQEALRLYPPAWILHRRVKEDDVVCGRRVHRGGSVVIFPVVLGRHPGFWERPEAFEPARWTDPEAERRRPRFAFLPFGGGPRQCIGNAFALLEAVLVLATLAPRFAPRLTPGYRPTPEYLVTLRPSGGLPMRLSALGREQAARPAQNG